MMMNKMYEVAGHRFKVSGSHLCESVDNIVGFKPFLVEQEGEVLFSFAEGGKAPFMDAVQYEFAYDDVTGTFGRSDNGFMLILKPQAEETLYLWVNDGGNVVWLSGNWSVRLTRFALWIGYGLMTLPYGTVAIHSSCIVYKNMAVLFLGESGTGKSTHTRLWRENIEGSYLLNDDSPIIRIEDGKVWAYGSPWSGKTPCYKPERYELKGCARLSQASYNKIIRLSVLEAYAAIHPSCPPEFAYDSNLYDHISGFIDKLISKVPFYHMACLPDCEAPRVSCQTIYMGSL